MSPSPRMNQPCGVNSAIVPMISGPWAVGEKVPPRTPSVIATAELAAPATSAELVNEMTSVEMPRAAITAAVQTSATPSGEPHEAPIRSVVATTRTVIASMPCDEAAQELAAQHGPRLHGPGQDPPERALAPFVEQADQAHLRGEEQEQDRHRRREVARHAQLAQRGRLVGEDDRGPRGGRGPDDPRLERRVRRRARQSRASRSTRAGKLQRRGHGQLHRHDPIAEALCDRPCDLRREARSPGRPPPPA